MIQNHATYKYIFYLLFEGGYMTQLKHQEKKLIVQSILNAFKELPEEGMSWFSEMKNDTSSYSWGYEFDR